MEKLLTAKEVADFLGVAVSTVYSWVTRHEIPVQRVQRALRFSPAQIQRWLKDQQQAEHPYLFESIQQREGRYGDT